MNFFSLEKTWHKFIVFCCIGGASTLIDWSMFNLFYKITSIFIFSLAMGFIISMTFNFTINRNYTFSARAYSIKKQLFRWVTIHGIAFLARTGIGTLSLYLLGESVLNVNIAYVLGLTVSIPITFLGSKNWAFKKN